jgi:hypothetical protein
MEGATKFNGNRVRPPAKYDLAFRPSDERGAAAQLGSPFAMIYMMHLLVGQHGLG